jgi:predicted metal-binding membrane protein
MEVSTNSAVTREVAEQAVAASPDRSEQWARATASGVFLLAAAYTFYAARGMSGGMRMPGGWTMPMMWMVMPGQSLAGAAFVFLLMWQAMMIAMMLPSSWPTLELYSRVARHTGQRWPMLNTVLAAAGYFTVWGAFGAIAFAAGFEISRAAMFSPQLSRWVPAGAGVSLVIAGVWQLTPLKQSCLQHCRDPLMFLGHSYQPGVWGGFRLGLHHGAFCAACCWALMLMQMLLGVMNLAVMTGVAAIIATEKLWKRGPLLARLVGAVSIVAGVALIARSI